MKVTVALVISFTSFALSAQTRMFGVKAGVGFTNVNLKHLNNDGNKDRVDFTGGVTYDYYWKNRFSFGGEILYQQRGYSLTKSVVTENKNNTSNYTGHHHSLSLAAGVKHKIN